MSIVSSTSTAGVVQADGRQYVLEEHTDHLGVVYRFEPLIVVAGTDLAAMRAARVVRLEEFLAYIEFRDRLTRVASLNLQHQTGGQFADRFRVLYKESKKEPLYELSWWVIEMITAGFLTDANVRSAFNMTAGQWATFKTDKVIPKHDTWTLLVNAQGE